MTPAAPDAAAPVHVLIPAAIQRRMTARVEALRGEIDAYVANLPAAQEPHP